MLYVKRYVVVEVRLGTGRISDRCRARCDFVGGQMQLLHLIKTIRICSYLVLRQINPMARMVT